MDRPFVAREVAADAAGTIPEGDHESVCVVLQTIRDSWPGIKSNSQWEASEFS